MDFAKALYFAAYYNPDNNFFHSYSANFFITKKRLLGDFIKHWYNYRNTELAFDSLYYEQLQDFSTYKKNLKKSKVGGSDDKIMKVLIHK